MCLAAIRTDKPIPPPEEEVMAWKVLVLDEVQPCSAYMMEPLELDTWVKARCPLMNVCPPYGSTIDYSLPREKRLSYRAGFHCYEREEDARSSWMLSMCGSFHRRFTGVVVPVRLKGVIAYGNGDGSVARDKQKVPVVVAEQMYISHADLDAALEKNERFEQEER